MDAHSASLFPSAVTVAETGDGIAKLQRGGATRKSEDLAAWLETVLHLYGDRVLAFDRPTALNRRRLRARGQGHAPGLVDIIIIAATAQHSRLDDPVAQRPAFRSARCAAAQSIR
jgi:toxin FitB